MRLPLGILTGIGFIGGGVILKHGMQISGVTTAATIWFVTVLGLLFGGGNLYLGIAGTAIALIILWCLKLLERFLSREFHGTLCLTFSSPAPSEADLRRELLAAQCKITHWNAQYNPPTSLSALECGLKWTAKASHMPETPSRIQPLRNFPGIRTLIWKE